MGQAPSQPNTEPKKQLSSKAPMTICRVLKEREEMFVEAMRSPRNELHLASQQLGGSARQSATATAPASIAVRVIDHARKSAVKVLVGDIKASGFLAKLHGRSCLVTNFHVLDRDRLNNGSFQLEWEGLGTLDVQLSTSDLRFGCELLDVAVVELPAAVRDLLQFYGARFAAPVSLAEVAPGTRVHILQFPLGGELIHSQGTVRIVWGCHVVHDVCTDVGSSGSMVFNSNGRILAIHKGCRVEPNAEDPYARQRSATAAWVNVAINYSRLEEYMGHALARCPHAHLLQCATPHHLNNDQLRRLGAMGLTPSSHPQVFISAASLLVTTLWFYRTPYAWFWTPSEPSSFDRVDLAECNWTPIYPGQIPKAFGGFWHGEQPALRNVELIIRLANSGTEFLL